MSVRLMPLAKMMTRSSYSTPYPTQSAKPEPSTKSMFLEMSSVCPEVHAFLSCGKLAPVVQIAAARPTTVANVLMALRFLLHIRIYGFLSGHSKMTSCSSSPRRTIFHS